MIDTVKVGLSIADNLFEQMNILLETYMAAHTTVFGRFGCLVIDFDCDLAEIENAAYRTARDLLGREASNGSN